MKSNFSVCIFALVLSTLFFAPPAAAQNKGGEREQKQGEARAGKQNRGKPDKAGRKHDQGEQGARAQRKSEDKSKTVARRDNDNGKRKGRGSSRFIREVNVSD